MAALADDLTRDTRQADSLAVSVVDAVTVFPGGLVALVTRGAAAADAVGRIKPYAKAAFEQPLGRADSRRIVGNAALAPRPEATFHPLGEIWNRVAVVGVVDNSAVGRKVFFTTDNDLQLARPAAPAMPCGRVIRWHAGAVCDVLLYSSLHLMQLAESGGDLESKEFPLSAAFAAPAVPLGPYQVRGHRLILSTYALVLEALGGGGDLTYTPTINGVAIPAGGGAVNVVAADAVGATKPGAAIAAAPHIHEGDTLGVSVAVAGASAAGRILFVFNLEKDLGL